jgi:F-type H+-transporting ATPase subunit b
MLSRFSLTFFLLFFSNKVLGAEEKGGMPQLNPESFSSQIFWLFVTFSILFLVIHFFLLPKLKKIREKREETVGNYLSQTQKLNEQIDVIITQIDQELNKAKISFNNKIKEELEKNKIIFEKEVSLIEKNFEKKKEKLNSELLKSQKDIRNKIPKICMDLSNDLYEKILGEKTESDPKEFEKVMRDL